MNLLLILAISLGIVAPPQIVYAEEKPIIALEAHHVETIITPEQIKPLTIEEKIIAKAEEYGYSTTTALAIAKAESGLNPDAKNKESSASGVYQYINGTFLSFCVQLYGLTDSLANKDNPDIQIECAIRMLSEGGEGHWDASKHIWKK